MTPRISIVTPSFNQGEFLEECIDSVLSQNYPNFEYIIMDGGSTDNSVEVIKKYEKHLTYWQSRPDNGQYEALSEGFKRTTGEILAWLNSDDKYHHHAFYKVAYIFTKYSHVEWLTGRNTLWDRNGNLSFIFYEFLPRFAREKYLQKNYRDPGIQQESTFWRRSLWERAGSGTNTEMKYAGDLELWSRFFRHAQLHTVDTMLGGYRKHGNQKSELYMDRYIREAEKILDEEIALYKTGESSDLLPTPEPIIIMHDELRTFMDAIYSSTQHRIYKISDDSDFVTDFLLQECVKYKKHSNMEELIKSFLVKLLRKFHLYNFYVRHERAFSRVYYFFRRLFISGNKKEKAGVI